MSRVIILLCALASVTVGLGPFPSPPTSGHIWPKPFRERKGHIVYAVDEHGPFYYDLVGYDCGLMLPAVEYTHSRLLKLTEIVRRRKHPSTNEQDVGNSDSPESNALPMINQLTIDLTQPCETYPHADMDESYNLTIGSVNKVTSTSIWGIIRGLESYSQLYYLSKNYRKVLINSTTIHDKPHYPHRGILVDTSRHYLSMGTIHKLLEGMAMNKMNVLHWHITDDPSFPYQSEKFPELSKKGAYYPSLTYDKSDIQAVIELARQRAIRVILEIDTPGHVTSWAESHPEIMTQCKETGRRPLNPVKDETYDLLRELYKEVQDMFPEQFVHLGGDEVRATCWTEDPITKQYMMEHQMSTDDLYGLYMNKTMTLLKNGSVPVMWAEAFFNNKTDMTNAVVQVWRTNKEMAEIIKKHVKVIFSTEWYLGYELNKGFDGYYKFDPRLLAYNVTQDHSLDKYIIGGEACMWGEMVDDTNILSRIFPRASGTAEVLWSFTNGTVPDEAYNRIEEHTCRMLRAGYPAAPASGPGFCITLDNIVKPKPKPKPFPHHQDHEPSESRLKLFKVVKRNRTKTPYKKIQMQNSL